MVKMKCRVYAFLVVLAFLFAVFVPLPAYAQQWTLVGQGGTWEQISLYHASKSGDNWGYAIWQTNVSNFQGFTVNVSINSIEVWKEWWEWGKSCIFEVRLILSNGTHSFGAYIRIEKWYEWWIASATAAYGGSYLDEDSIAKLGERYPTLGMRPDPVFALISVHKDGKVYLLCKAKDGEWHGDYDAVGYRFQGDNVTIQMGYFHSGRGKFDMDIQHLTYQYYVPYKEEPKKDWWWALWDGLMRFFSGIPQWLSWISAIIVTVFTSFSLILPFIFLFVFLWILDAVIISILTGNIQVIGNVFMTIYDFVRAVIQTIVNIAETIWNIIKFW